MPEKPSSNRGRLLRVGAAGLLAAALGVGVSHFHGETEACSDDSSEAGDTDTSPDSPEAGREPTPTLIGRLQNATAALSDDTLAISEETRRIEAERRLLSKAVMNLATEPDLSYKPFNEGRGPAPEGPGPEEPDSAEPGI